MQYGQFLELSDLKVNLEKALDIVLDGLGAGFHNGFTHF